MRAWPQRAHSQRTQPLAPLATPRATCAPSRTPSAASARPAPLQTPASKSAGWLRALVCSSQRARMLVPAPRATTCLQRALLKQLCCRWHAQSSSCQLFCFNRIHPSALGPAPPATTPRGTAWSSASGASPAPLLRRAARPSAPPAPTTRPRDTRRPHVAPPSAALSRRTPQQEPTHPRAARCQSTRPQLKCNCYPSLNAIRFPEPPSVACTPSHNSTPQSLLPVTAKRHPAESPLQSLPCHPHFLKLPLHPSKLPLASNRVILCF